MNEKRFWIGVFGGGGLCVALCGFLIYSEYGSIAAARENVAGLHQTIDASRKLLTQTGQLERDVIVLRETEEGIKEILPNEADVNNFVRDLRRFEEESGVRITGLKKKAELGNVRARNKEASTDFEKVTYTLTIEADAFQWMSFLDRVESHSRFMTVPTFKLSAAPRRQVEEGEGPYAHKIQMDVETYVYAPQGALTSVKIDGYQRKKELLLGEIARHRGLLAIPTFQYRGPRGRRDPWVDPRVSATPDETGLTIEAQTQIVDDLMIRADEVFASWDKVVAAPTIVEEVTLRAELEKQLSRLEEEVRRVQEAASIKFAPAKNKLDHQIADRLVQLRTSMTAKEDGQGPSADRLRELYETMHNHMEQGEYDLALTAYTPLETGLSVAEQDDLRKQVVLQIRGLAKEARIASDFLKIKLEIGGVAIMEGQPPAVIINGRAWGEGDMPDQDLVIKTIREGEIEFIFRGVVLLRRL